MSGGNSGVESLPSKQMVAGSNPVPRSIQKGADNWFAYALRSMKDGWLYIGISSDVAGRLIYVEQCGSRVKARGREKFLKSGVGREFLKRIETNAGDEGARN